MDFNQLMMKMRELDQPTTEGGCGMDAPMAPPPLSAVPPKPETPPPSMSVNINAQGLENIEDMMKLFQKVNPDMGPMDKPELPPLPTLSMEPKISALPPLKMLPDFDADNDDKIGGEMDSDYNKDGKLDPHEKDHADEKPLLKTLDKDDDGDHDMDDHDLEKKSKEEEYANEPDIDIKDVDYMNNKLAGGMNRPKDTFPKVSDGDNPMKKSKFESGDLRAQIRAELLQRLAEAKGAK
jgi:hypothetical protein